MHKNQLAIKINESDFLKVFAVSAVMMQTVLSIVSKQTDNPVDLAMIGALYNAVKYTAPMFIFAIVFNMVKTGEHLSYKAFWKEKFPELVVPYLIWSSVYLLLLPNVQQATPYNSFGSFIQKMISGDAAPHLWYTIMMLQIQLLMPFFIWLSYQWFNKRERVIPTLVFSTALYILWYKFYLVYVLYGPYHEMWRYLDRFVLSFLIYGIYGAAAYRYRDELFLFLNKRRFILIPLTLLTWMYATKEMFSYGAPFSFHHSPYLKTTMSLYSILMILLVFVFAYSQIRKQSPSLVYIKYLSTFAYRTYLANVFVLQYLIRIFGNTLSELPIFMMIIVLYFLTVTTSFLFTFIIHRIVTFFK